MTRKLRKILSCKLKQENITFGRIFSVQIILFYAIYGIMLVPRFSTDAYSAFFSTGSNLDTGLSLGRIGIILLNYINMAVLALGSNPITISPLYTAVFILTLAWSAAVLLSLLKPYFPNLNWLTVLLVDSGIVLSYANIYFAENFTFTEAPLMFMFADFFLTLALLLFFHRNQVIGTIFALVCLYLSLNFYQAFLGFFMIFGSMMILVRNNIPETQWKKRDIKPLALDFLRLVAVGGGSSVAVLLGMSLFATMGYTSDRGASLHMTDIFNSIQQLIWQFEYYYPSGYPYYLTGLMKIIFVLSGPVLLCLLVGSFFNSKRRWKQYPFSAVAITLAVLFCGFLSAFAPHFLSKSVWLVPRSICSFFAGFTVMAIIIGYNYSRSGKAMPYAGTVVVLLLLIANIVAVQGIALDQITINRQDKAEAEEIIRYIQEYESESGQSVDTISWRTDSRYTWTHPGIKYMFMDMNVRAGARSWSLISCISYYAGYRFESETMPDEIWAENFQGQEWDFFLPEEQIRFGGNKMYLMVY